MMIARPSDPGPMPEAGREVLGLLVARSGAAGPPGAGPAADEDQLARLLEAGLGGVVLPAADPASLGAAASTVRAASEGALLLAEERDVLDDRRRGPITPAAAALGALDDVDATRELGEALGDVLAACGIEMLLGPRLDVAAAEGSVAGTAAFGTDPDLVTRHARSLAGGVRENGTAACGMHLIGGGALVAGAAPTVALERRELESQHLGPWDLAPWLDGVMTAPLQVPALGEGTASTAPWAASLLEESTSTHHRGLLLAGHLPQAAEVLGISLGEAALRALHAGAHLLDVGSPAAASAVRDALAEAIAQGRLDAQLVRERRAETDRLIRAQRARRRWLPSPQLEPSVAALQGLAGQLSARALRSRHGQLVPGPVTVVDLRRASPQEHPAVAVLRPRRSDAPAALIAALQDEGLAVHRADYPQDALRAAQPVLLTDDDSSRAPMPPGELLAARPDAVLVHTGTEPLLPEAPRWILACDDGPAAMEAVAARLAAGLAPGR